MEGATLTMEGVCQIFQIIQFLDRTNNIEQIGLFRKTGNLQKQKVSINYLVHFLSRDESSRSTIFSVRAKI